VLFVLSLHLRRHRDDEDLTFHSNHANYFRLARRLKIGHDAVSGLQRRFS